MALKIKWNDDRVRDAMAAVLLLARERLAGGNPENLIAAALEEYRTDPAAYKAKRKASTESGDPDPLRTAAQIARYEKLRADVERLRAKWTATKRQFNSLRELDHALAEHLA